MDKLNIDPVLGRLLKDIHASTWYTLTGGDLVKTMRGTRPGSPLADAIFHLLMTEIANELRQWISQQPYLYEAFTRMGLDPVFVIWSDDFAIPVATPTADALVDSVVELTKHIHGLFAARGFTVNFDAGKTSAVLTFVGHRAPEMRKAHLLTPKPGVEIELIEGRQIWLHFSMKYKQAPFFRPAIPSSLNFVNVLARPSRLFSSSTGRSLETAIIHCSCDSAFSKRWCVRDYSLVLVLGRLLRCNNWGGCGPPSMGCCAKFAERELMSRSAMASCSSSPILWMCAFGLLWTAFYMLRSFFKWGLRTFNSLCILNNSTVEIKHGSVDCTLTCSGFIGCFLKLCLGGKRQTPLSSLNSGNKELPNGRVL